MQTDPQKPAVLVYVNGDALGDSLLKLPALMALRSAFPGKHITWFAGRGKSIFSDTFAPLVAGAVDSVQDQVPLGMSWRELLTPPLQGCFYDTIIDTQSFIRTTLILKKIPHNTFISPAFSFIFSDRKPVGVRKQKGSVYERILQLVQLACGRTVAPVFSLNLPGPYRDIASTLLPPGPCYIGLAPGAGQRIKCWPLNRFIEIGKRQAGQGRKPVFLIGPQETEWIPAIRTELPEALFPEQSDVAKQHGGPLLTIALAERIAAGVANDSGTGHIMAIAGRPLLSLFGPSDARKFAGNYPNKKIISARSFGGVDMDRIPVDAVNEGLNTYLEQDNGA